MTKKELMKIKGGAGISGTLINGFVRGIEQFLNIGRSVGTAIRRLGSGNICPL